MESSAPTDIAAPLILIVEDDPGTRGLYREQLALSGFRTVEAHNGRQALAKARECRPAAVLTDIAVPGLDGFELCRELHRSRETCDIPVLAVTGRPEYLDQPERMRRAGITQILVKPIRPDTIVFELRRLLS